MSQSVFTVPWMDSRYFDAQLEDYLLRDAQRCDQAGGLPSLGKVQYHETEDSEWLTLTGVVAGALIDSQELVYKAHRGSDGSFKGAAILQVEKRDGETCLIHREPLVVMEKLKGKI